MLAWSRRIKCDSCYLSSSHLKKPNPTLCVALSSVALSSVALSSVVL